MDAFLLRLLPVRDPQQLVLVRPSFSYATYLQLRQRSQSFCGMFAYDESHITVTVDGQPEYLDGDFVSGSYFEVLGVSAIAGRAFGPTDDQPGKPPVAVLSFGYWQRRFARGPNVIGKTIFLGGIPFTIAGVMGPHFYGRNVAGKTADIIVPMSAHQQLALKDHTSVNVIARLRPTVSMEQARAELDVLHGQILTATAARLSPQALKDLKIGRVVLRPGLRGESDSNSEFSTQLRILAAVVGIALLIASINVANLLLARAAARQKEIAVRLAIGASRVRLIRQLLTESIVLAIAGGALGLLLAKAGVGLLLQVLAYGGSEIPFELHLDARVLAFTFAVSLGTGILFGLAPATIATGLDLNPALKGTERGSERRPLRAGLLNALVVAQVALSLVLLIGSGLLIRSLSQLYSLELGYDRDKVLVTWVFPVLAGYDHSREMSLYRDLPDRLGVIPGVESVSLSRLRLTRGGWFRNISAPSHGSRDESGQVYCGIVGPRFFATTGIHLLQGREFTASDAENTVPVAIVSEATARHFFPNQNPVGQQLRFVGDEEAGAVEIIGVVRDVRHRLLEDRAGESVYVPYTQAPVSMLGQMNLLIRSSGTPTNLRAAIREQVRAIDHSLPLVAMQTIGEEVDRYFGGQRSLATLMSFFGMLALALTSVGLYGTISYAVRRRTRDIGIRLALGASASRMRWMVLRQAFLLALLGVTIGVPLAAAATRLIASMLSGVTANDPIVIAGAIAGLLGTALLAGYLPARRATRIDPREALRCE